MPRSTSPSEPSGEPRDNTVDLPRLDVSGLANIARRATLPEQEPAELLEPLPEQEPGPAQWYLATPESRGQSTSRSAPQSGLRHPYADPDEPARPTTWRAFEPTAPGGNARTAPAQPAPAPVAPASSQSAPHAPAQPAPAPVASADSRSAPLAPPSVAAASAGVAPVSAGPAPGSGAASHAIGAASPAAEAPGEPDAPRPQVPAAPSPATGAAASPVAGSPGPAARTPSRPPADRAAQDRANAVGPAGRAPAGSRADLRSRLDRLPDGHPSSAYEDDGRAKPLPIRLKQLELGLPAPGRELGASFRPDTESGDIELLEPQRAAPASEPPEPARPAPEETVTEPARPAPEVTVAEPARPLEVAAAEPARPAPDPVALEAAEADPGEPEAGADPATPKAADAAVAEETAAEVDSDPAEVAPSSPVPPDWSNPYASAGNGRVMLASDTNGPPAELTLGPWRTTPAPRKSGLESLTLRGGNGHNPSNGLGNDPPHRATDIDPGRPGATAIDADRQTREFRPDRRHAAGDIDRRDTAQHRIAELPTADLRELVERMLASARVAEGRNVVGSYGNSGLTPAMQRLAAQLPFGGLAPDSEASSLKSTERLAAKLTRLIARNPGRTAEGLAATIGDVVRYAFAFEAADYVEGTWLVHRRLKSRGFELEIRRNRWESPEYKGIFTQWRDPAHHVAFEVQFHTTASWAVMQRTHNAYVQITDPDTPAAERAKLRARQVAAAAAAKAPPNWAEIDDFRLEPR